MDKRILCRPDDMREHKWRVLLGVSIASFLGCIDFTIVNTVVPDIQSDLHIGVDQSQLLISVFLMALCANMVVAGRLADLYGRRLLLYIGMAVFGTASLGAGFATNIYHLVAFRFEQGMACAILYTASAAIVSNAFPDDERGRAIGLLFGINGVGLAIGPVLGGVLLNAFGWRSVFLVNVPLILLSLFICLGSVRESRNMEDGGGVDWLGLILLVGALTALLLGITQGMGWGWFSIRTLSCFAISSVLCALLVPVERAALSPIIQIELFLNREFVAASIATFSLAFFYCAAFFLMPLYLRIVGHFGGLMIGVMLLPTTAVMAAASPIAGRLCDRIGAKKLLVAGFACFSVSAAMQAQFSITPSIEHILVAYAAMGLGWACILTPSTVAALSSVPENFGGVATGASWTLHNLGGAIGLSIATIVYQTSAMDWMVHVAEGRFAIDPAMARALVSDPAASAMQISQVNISVVRANSLIEQLFVHGYQASMRMLVVVSLLALASTRMSKSRIRQNT